MLGAVLGVLASARWGSVAPPIVKVATLPLCPGEQIRLPENPRS